MKVYEVPTICNQFLDYLTKWEYRSSATIRAYSNDLKLIYDFIKVKKGLADIDVDNINTITDEDYLKYLNTCHSVGTKNRRLATLKKFYEWLLDNEYIMTNKVTKIKCFKNPKRLVKYFNIDEAKSIQQAAKNDKNNSERNLCIINLLLYLGLRVSELVDINIDDIDLYRKNIYVIGKGDKERFVPLPDACISALNAYLKARPKVKGEMALFLSNQNKRISVSSIQKLTERLMDYVGVDISKYHTHSFRHFAATNMLENDVPLPVIQSILGHEKIETTLIYAEVTDRLKRKAMNAISI